MGISQATSFELPDGLVPGEGGPYVTGGSGSPVGTAAPIYTIYFRSNGEVWRAFGTGASDWERILFTRDPVTVIEGDFLRYIGGYWVGSTLVGSAATQYFGFSAASTIVVNHGLGRTPIFQLREDVTAASGTVKHANEARSNTFDPGVGFITSSTKLMPYTNIASIVHNTVNQSTITLVVAKTGVVIVVG